MKRNETRHAVISAFLQAGGPLTLDELLGECRTPKQSTVPVLKELVEQGLVAEGQLLPDKPAPQYCWGARWAKVTARRAADSQQGLQTTVDSARESGQALDIDSDPIVAFHNYIINEYQPPKDKRFLVFFQCSVRRPFSTSPSHASMRRAITVATGYEPRKDFESCPVHVVVASTIGPVPYELEDVYPENVGGGGVKHFHPEHYARVKPILAQRMADYVIAHRGNYDKAATFTEGRYGEVMVEAREIAIGQYGKALDFPIFPRRNGARVTQMGKSKPRQYWAKYWIQLYLEIVSWLGPTQQAEAEARLKKLKVKYELAEGGQ